MKLSGTVVGMTGHRDLNDLATSRWVSEAVGLEIERFSASSGVSCLAIGADQIFAEEILIRGLELTTIVPSVRYEDSFEKPDELARYRSLLERSSRIVNLAHESNSDEAFLAGGQAVVDASAVLLTVWDGQPSRGLGGTADIVEYARRLNRRIVHINPIERAVASLK